MTVESWGTGEASGLRRKWYLGSLVVGVLFVVFALAAGRPAGAFVGLVIGLASTLRLLSIRGQGIDPSKSTVQRMRNREFRKYGRPF